MTEKHTIDARICKPEKGELLALFLILAAFWVVNLATCSRSPPVWLDEVAYSDPAVNLYLGNGFQSTAWEDQPSGRFWAGNVPLYPFLLFIWLKAFGFSIVAVRSFNFFLVSLATMLVWLFSLKSGAITKPWARILLVLLVFCGHGVVYAYRSGRPDMLGFLLIAILPLLHLVRNPLSRVLGLGIIGALLPFAGAPVLCRVRRDIDVLVRPASRKRRIGCLGGHCCRGIHAADVVPNSWRAPGFHRINHAPHGGQQTFRGKSLGAASDIRPSEFQRY